MEISVLSSLPLIPNKTHDSKHYNSLIKQYTKSKNDLAILTTYTQMEAINILPDHNTLPIVLKACSKLQVVDSGKRLHAHIVNTNLINDVRVGTALVDFYCKCGLFEDARYVFDGMPERDVVAWNAMISGCVSCREYEAAINLFMEMHKESWKANSSTVVALLLACGELLNLRIGKEIHGFCLRNGFCDFDCHVGTALIGFYSKFDVTIAFLVFSLMASKNTVSWNAMITGYLETGEYLKALKLFVHMLVEDHKCDAITMLIVLQACTEYGALDLGLQVHQFVVKLGLCKDMYIKNALINMYSKNGMMSSSYDLFKSVSTIDVALWNSMISSFLEGGSFEEALGLFSKMQLKSFKNNPRTIVIGLRLCVHLHNGLRDGQAQHASIIKNGMERNMHVINALLVMYSELNSIEDAMKIFQEIKDVDVVSWNTLMMALAKNKLTCQAWAIFKEMKKSEVSPNSHTLISILASCKDETLLTFGRSIHAYAIKHSLVIDPSFNTALAEMYMNCNDEATATKLFERFEDKDLISWNSMIDSYVKNNQAQKALLLFQRMISEIEPNQITIINVLSACTKMVNLHLGQCLHAYTLRRQSSFGIDLNFSNALITMYARCGSMHCANNIFETLSRKNIVSWNAMIAGYGMHGHGNDAMLVFKKMLYGGFKPNGITFVSAMSACSHSGLVEKGLQLFNSMIEDYYITPEVVHYACVVDLLCRGGSLTEARNFIDSMPIAPDASVWRALLSGCRVYSDTKLAKTISNKLFELEPTNAGNYVLVSNIYAAAGLWSEQRKVDMLLIFVGCSTMKEMRKN